jgi:hypothetical protein
MIFLILAVVIVAVGILLNIKGDRWARDYIVHRLEQKYGAGVQLEMLDVSVLPHIRARGSGLAIRKKGQEDLPPFIAVKNFSVDTTIAALLHDPWHVRHARLEGLEIHVAPRKSQPSSGKRRFRVFPDFVIDEIQADGTLLEILPRKPGKLPLRFEIERLLLHSVGRDRHLSFRATLTNPKPPGKIETQGNFGPWRVDEPDKTPVSGQYTFNNADLSVFRGISGILSSEGHYAGVLERIDVQGSTDTPDFAVAVSGHPVHLKTDFHAIVDGTNGDTLLQPVVARWGESSVTAVGKVAGQPGVKGKAVILDVSATRAHLQDLLRLAVKSDAPPLSGRVSFRMAFSLPPGDQDISEKLRLNGTFALRAAQFTSVPVQKKLARLSRRARGLDTGTGDERVVSNLSGRIQLGDGVADFPKLSFGVPGAEVRLGGTYGLKNEQLDFRGQLRMQAKLSQTVHGIKSILLKPIDPLFHKDGAGMVLPIKITGPRSQPKFGLDVGRLFGRGKKQSRR